MLRVLIVTLAMLAALQPAHAQFCSAGKRAAQPGFVGCQPPVSSIARTNVLPLAIGDNLGGVTVGQVLGQITASDIATGLGYAPVQQGTGIGQTGNTLKLGWSNSLGKLRLTVDSTDIGSIATETWATARTPRSILDFGAACNGTTDDTAAITQAMATGRRISIPDGRICYGASISQAGITTVFVGPGQIKTSDGNLRGPLVSQIAAAPVRIGSANVVEGFNGDLSKVPIAIEHRIGGDALGYPTTGYKFVNETSAVYISSFNSSGWNNGTGEASGSAGRTGFGLVTVDLTQAGQGDGSAFFGSATVSGVKAGATSFLANGAAAILTGVVSAGANGVYLQPIGDMNCIDQGYAAACIGSNINLFRTNAGAALGQTWIGYRSQNGGSVASDAAFSASGNYKMVVDGVDAFGTVPVVVMGAGQKIYGNAVQPDTRAFPSTVSIGTQTLGYEAAKGWHAVGGMTVDTGALVLPTGTPASSSAACTAGQRLTDSNFVYVCVATNTWRSVPLSDFGSAGGGSASPSGFVRTVYTASGAISAADTLSIINGSAGTPAMTLPICAVDGQSKLIKQMGSVNATVSGVIDGASQVVTLTASAAGTLRDALKLRCSTADASWLAE